MFRDLWDRKQANMKSEAKALASALAKVEEQMEQTVERIVETSVPAVIRALEAKVVKLEKEKLLIAERMAQGARPANDFNKKLRTALSFLANPSSLWETGQVEDRRAVLKLTFADRLRYKRGEGFRTTDLALPFRVLGDFLSGEKPMARPKGFEPLTPRFVDWGRRLKTLNDFANRIASCASRINALACRLQTIPGACSRSMGQRQISPSRNPLGVAPPLIAAVKAISIFAMRMRPGSELLHRLKCQDQMGQRTRATTGASVQPPRQIFDRSFLSTHRTCKKCDFAAKSIELFFMMSGHITVSHRHGKQAQDQTYEQQLSSSAALPD